MRVSEMMGALRPANLSEFVGQDSVRSQLETMIAGAKRRDEPLSHLLLSGPKGLGKTSLARIAASEMGGGYFEIDGHALTSPSDVVALLGSLRDNDVLFVDEIHRVPSPVEEAFYKPLEEFKAQIVDKKGEPMTMQLKNFTCIGATTVTGKISAPLRERFGAELPFDWYSDSELAAVLKRAEGKVGLTLESDARQALAAHGRGTPREVLRLLRRLRDYSASDSLSLLAVLEALRAMQIHDLGLTVKDVGYLSVLASRAGQPAGIKALGAMLNEDEATIEGEIEPYLLAQGFIDLGVNGRTLTRDGERYLREAGRAA